MASKTVYKNEGNIFSQTIDFMLLGGFSILFLPIMYFTFPPGNAVENSLKENIISIVIALDFIINFPHFAYSYQLIYGDFIKG